MYTLNVEKRDVSVKAKKLRRLGTIPGSIGGKNLTENILIQMPVAAARKFLKEKAKGANIVLVCGAETYNVILKDVMRAPIDGQLLDLSFQLLTENEPVNSIAQVVLKNLDKMTMPYHKLQNEIPYRALPSDLVESVEIDLGTLRPGDFVKLQDLPIAAQPEVELLIAPATILLSVSERR